MGYGQRGTTRGGLVKEMLHVNIGHSQVPCKILCFLLTQIITALHFRCKKNLLQVENPVQKCL
jgi:hypothetical protein